MLVLSEFGRMAADQAEAFTDYSAETAAESVAAIGKRRVW
jgi:hypothetical protein